VNRRFARFLLLPAMVFATASAAKTIRVDAIGIAFSPANISAQAGDIVVWTNKDFVAHTATAQDKSFDVILPPGKSGRAVLKKAGTIDYYCRYHPTMKGEIKVGAK
jgi:plastocyanin